jgi:hypothetical protein
MRVLALALLALALGRPAFRGDFAFGKSRGESAAAFVLDRSFSMRVEGARETLWQKAKDRARESLEALETDDTVFLLGVDPGGEAVESYRGRAASADAVRSQEPGYGTTDLPGAVRRAMSALSGATALNKELFIFSDFQRSALGPAGEAPENLLADAPADVRVYLVPVDEGALPNTALAEARLEGTALDQRVSLEAVRYAEGAEDETAVTVEAGAEVLGEARLIVAGGSRETALVPLTRMPAEGEPVIARLARDRLDVDDVRYLATAGSGAVPTWVVQDPARPSPYVPLALSPAGESGSFAVRLVSPDELIGADPSETRLVVLDNVTALSADAISRLRSWHEAGGALLIALGDRVDLRHYNESLLPALFPGVSLGNVLGSDEPGSATYTLTARNPGHRAFSGFEAGVGQPLTGAMFWRIVETKAGPGLRTLAEFGPGLPALLAGEGALLFASSLDGRWNNFPTHAAFVPLLHQSLDAVLAEGSDARLLVGERLTGTVDRVLLPTGAELTALGPEGLVLGVEMVPEARGFRIRSEPVSVPGFYSVRAGDHVILRRAVNVNAEAESDLAPASREELRQAFSGDRVRILEPEAPIGTPVREARYGREIWRELVVVVLLLMVTEGWLSRRGVTA